MDRFHIQHADDATRIKNGHANFAGHALDRENKIAKLARVFDQAGLAGADHVAHYATRNRQAMHHLVVTDIVLQDQRITLEQVQTDHRITKMLRGRLNDGTDDRVQTGFVRNRRADLLEQCEGSALQVFAGQTPVRGPFIERFAQGLTNLAHNISGRFTGTHRREQAQVGLGFIRNQVSPGKVLWSERIHFWTVLQSDIGNDCRAGRSNPREKGP